MELQQVLVEVIHKIQFNDGGNLAGDSDFVFDKSTNRLTVTNPTVDSPI